MSSSATEAAEELRQETSDPTKRARLLQSLAKAEPALVREWIQEHPRNLYSYCGWGVQPFHNAAFTDLLTQPEFLWLAPRSSGKSIAECIFFPAWLALSDPEVYTKAGVDYLFPEAPKTIGPHNIRIGMISNSQEKAMSLQWLAKQTLIRPEIEMLFGPMAGGRWRDVMSDTSLRTEKLRECTFTSVGLGSKVTGGHYDVLIADDCVTEDNARTEHQRQVMSNFWKFTVRPMVEPWGRIAAAGTRYHPQDWYQEIKEWESKKLWAKVRRTPALTEVDGKPVSYWPEVYPVSKLLKIKETVGAFAFGTQYQNETDLLLGEFFEKEWVESFRDFSTLPRLDREKARTLIALDPAIKAGPRNDFSVFTVLSYVAPYFFVRRIVRGQWTQHQLVKIAQMLFTKYHPEVLGVEVVQGQEWLVQELRRLTSINVRAMRPQQSKGKDKVGRASSVRALFERGMVFFDEPTPDNGIQRLIEEMMAFPGSSDTPGMDDCVDSLVWALLLIARPVARMHRLRDRRSI